MNTQDYTYSISVNATAQETSKAINEVAKWWTENLEGHTQNVGDEFTVRFGETYISMKVSESIPGEKIIWYVSDCNKHWLKNKKEWNGTQLVWNISNENGTNKITLQHVGLVPELECYGACSNAWGEYLQSLQRLINTGKGKPDPKED